MRKSFWIVALICALLVPSCAKQYTKAIIGKWDAGKASTESRIIVAIRSNGSLTATLTNTEIRPTNGTYTISGDLLVITLPGTTLSYRIMSLDDRKLVMSSEARKITWNRLE